MIREEWDLPLVYAMNRQWHAQPPTHELLAMHYGYKVADLDEPSADDLDDLPQDLPAATISSSDFDELLRTRGYA